MLVTRAGCTEIRRDGAISTNMVNPSGTPSVVLKEDSDRRTAPIANSENTVVVFLCLTPQGDEAKERNVEYMCEVDAFSREAERAADCWLKPGQARLEVGKVQLELELERVETRNCCKADRPFAPSARRGLSLIIVCVTGMPYHYCHQNYHHQQYNTQLTVQ